MHNYLGALLVLVLREGIEKRSEHSNARADRPERRDRRLEHEDGREDDDHTLDGVRDGVGDGGDLRESEEGDLVINVVQKARAAKQLDELCVGVPLGQRGRPRSCRCLGRLEDERNGRDGDEAEDGEDGEHIGWCKVLTEGLAVEHFLRENRLGRRGHGAARARNEGHPREGQLLQAREGDAADDRDEGEVDGQRQELAENDCR
mmetsp:Transcript_44744/g.117343  ORF Transcript_44744/g.117343 Transcript_44744/m.117343 type:complete len:204 (+) Transcript_44744:242-853(+)